MFQGKHTKLNNATLKMFYAFWSTLVGCNILEEQKTLEIRAKENICNSIKDKSDHNFT